MSCAIIIYGPIGSGKTKTCLELVDRARTEGVTLCGIISPRVFVDGDLIGYDCLNLASGETFPLVRLRDEVDGHDWLIHGELKYAFHILGFERANKILMLSAKVLNRPTLTFVDEFGRLEKVGKGLHLGVMEVSEALSEGGVAVFTCRSDLIGYVEELVRGKVSIVLKQEPGDVDLLWQLIMAKLESGLNN